MKLYVGNMSFDTTEDSLQQLFSNYGEVQEVAVITDRETGRSRGFGFITFEEDSAASTAILEMNGTEMDGRKINVNEAQDKRRDNRGGGRGGGGGYGGGGGGGGYGGGGGGQDRW